MLGTWDNLTPSLGAHFVSWEALSCAAFPCVTILGPIKPPLEWPSVGYL